MAVARLAAGLLDHLQIEQVDVFGFSQLLAIWAGPAGIDCIACGHRRWC